MPEGLRGTIGLALLLLVACASPPPPAPPTPPASPPWPMTALEPPAEGALVLVPRPLRAKRGAPPFMEQLRGDLAAALAERVRVRLPAATLETRVPGTVAEGRDWLRAGSRRGVLTVLGEKAQCRESRRGGRVAEGTLRIVLARPTRATFEVLKLSLTLEGLPPWACVEHVVAFLFEKALAHESVLETLRAPEVADSVWSSSVVRALFPGLESRIIGHINAGLAQLSRGKMEEAADSFEKALQVDPDDRRSRSYLREVETDLALQRELSQLVRTPRPVAPVSPESDLVRHAGPLRAERLDELVAVMDARDRRRLEDEALATFVPVEIGDPDAAGPRLARARAGGPVEARRVLPDAGSSSETLATYYFSPREADPVLRELDTDGDGRPDRWAAYDGRIRREVWEDRSGNGRPDFHAIFAPAGDLLERVEIDADEDGHPERIFSYQSGVVRSEARDSNGDGVMDRFEEFNAAGQVTLREEDLDGDGLVDVRSRYEDGRLTSREVENPELLESLMR